MILLAVGPTSTYRRKHGGTPAPCGTWKVAPDCRPRGRSPLNIDAWIQRDDPSSQASLRRQSHFEDVTYVRFEEPYGRPKEVDFRRRAP